MWRAIVFMVCGVFVLISISACTNAMLKDKYPEYFSQIKKKSGECADISGKYEFSTLRLTQALDKEGCPYSTIERDVFGIIELPSGCIFSTIEIHSDEISLQAVMSSDDKEVHKSLSRDSGDYQCYGDGIILSDKSHDIYDGIGSSKTFTIVYPAVDGSLLLWHGRISSGLILFAPLPPIPFSEHEGVWYRHEPVE